MNKKKNCALSLSGIVDKMNDMYEGVIGDGFNLGVDKRIIPVMVNDKVVGWRIQKQISENSWVDLCDETFNTTKELIDRYRGYTEKELESINE
jgi:hypothetical protein